jgi:hypothetical protein
MNPRSDNDGTAIADPKAKSAPFCAKTAGTLREQAAHVILQPQINDSRPTEAATDREPLEWMVPRWNLRR